MTSKQKISDEWEPIKLSARVFGHISQGLYRTSAGAIKELVSNAFDAKAKRVRIHTGFPRFETFSCRDDGEGLARAEFDRLMDEGVGTSTKREDPKKTLKEGERPLIGRLGIGMLSLAQICHRFKLTSHHPESRTAFEAEIKFRPYTRKEVDEAVKKDEPFEGGDFRIKKLVFDKSRKGVTVFSDRLREPYRKNMANLKRYLGPAPRSKPAPYPDFESFMRALYSTKAPIQSLNLLSAYDQLLFGLAMACPIAYWEQPPGNVVLQVPSLKAVQKQLLSYDFVVEVDHLGLAKPISLPSDRNQNKAEQCKVGRAQGHELVLEDGAWVEHIEVKAHDVAVSHTDLRFRIYEIEYDNDNVAGFPLRFSGYAFQQTGRLYPNDITGVLVRIRNVAIGRYDASLMTYPYGEGPRFSMVSIELNVTEGFEDALNIDRDSFNELHAHYVRTQRYVHTLLHELVFKQTWSEEKKRNVRRRESKEKATEQAFLESVSLVGGRKFRKIVRGPTGRSPVRFDVRGKTIEVDLEHELLEGLPRTKQSRQLAEKVAIAYEAAGRAQDRQEQRRIFYRILSRMLNPPK